MADAPIQSKHRETMNAIARGLDDVLNGKDEPKTLGFAIIIGGLIALAVCRWMGVTIWP